mgnify:CR=1 FL=1
MSSRSDMRPLEGIKVLDLSRVLAGPTATAVLGDLGCDVIKIENPDGGDETRGWGPPWAGTESAYYLSANRNKRSLTLNLKHPEGIKIVERILKDSDVVILNFPGKRIEKLGFTYDWAKKIKPDIIWANISGFGLTGPKKDLPGYDILIQGMSGLMSVTGEADGGPVKVGVAVADVFTALYTVIAILAALKRRTDTGEGTAIDNSLYECMTSALVNVANNYLIGGLVPKRFGTAHPNIVPYQAFKASDIHIIVGVGNDRQFREFSGILGRPEWADDERFSSNALRVKNRRVLLPLIEAEISKRTADEWTLLLEEKEIPVAPINTMDRTFSDEQFGARGFIQTVPHVSGEIKLMKNPIHFSDMDTSIYRAPPTLGEHTEEILAQYGYSPEDILRLKKDNAI